MSPNSDWKTSWPFEPEHFCQQVKRPSIGFVDERINEGLIGLGQRL